MATIKTSNGKLSYTIECGVVVLDNIIVDEQSRNQGVASKLMGKLLARFKNKTIELHAYPQDDTTTIDKLIVFYQKFGFQITCGSDATGYEMKLNQ